MLRICNTFYTVIIVLWNFHNEVCQVCDSVKTHLFSLSCAATADLGRGIPGCSGGAR
jgi:hypothetical protein